MTARAARSLCSCPSSRRAPTPGPTKITYQGDVANIGGAANNPIKSGTMTFNPDGTLANADSANSPASGDISLTLPWDTAASGLNPQTITLNMGTVDGSDGMTQFDSASTQVSSKVDGALFGSLSGVIGRQRTAMSRRSSPTA